ncbi:J domain-containing protein [Nakamurella multipartita]|uniref:Heat shock protein DnaJ domain protein n=1 Tax=Nakamurella multipartita (strain ATCC 700099 / DSM 44233 / CIP 104796 / JCM 9543 / NBRC 105858 / Y-104) TaxID=479431 RepID=C8X8K6_NAKMY|nr:J domain-containing protein [Nakamurella multipartita]ACV79061.1 heat shock protein DnaJ domain protein [Nakamurella multipartita DSM 44233]
MVTAQYPESLAIRPLTTWPGRLTPDAARVVSPFTAPLASTLRILDRELDAIGARHPVLEVAIDPTQFRIDGRPRATARAGHPGVVLSLPHTGHGPLRYATDRFVTWQENLRAVALGLEALRRVERYGITRRGEQYVGFAALPPGQGAPGNDPMTLARALAFLTEHSGQLLSAATPIDDIDRAYRRVARVLHPDSGGDPALFHILQEAISVLRAAR